MERRLDSAGWNATELQRRGDWQHRFGDAEVAEIDAALRSFHSSGLALERMRREDFPLPRFEPVARRLLEALENGPGVFLIQGFPVERYSTAELRTVYWGLGRHIGTAVAQSSAGDVLGDVRDLSNVPGLDYRSYRSADELRFHTDGADVTGLFVLQTSKTGGLSGVVSSVRVHDEIARQRPDLLDALYQPLPLSRQDGRREGVTPWYMQPVFTRCEGHFSCYCIRNIIDFAQSHTEAPRLSPLQQEALALMDETCSRKDLVWWKEWQRGDLQFSNNHTTLHARTEFEDFPEPARKRHLLRLWLSVPNSRPLSEEMKTSYRDVRAGAVRGGAPFREDGRVLFETKVV
jgi:hypothetical protein